MLTKLKTLDLSGNSLKSIPIEVYRLSNVKSLFLTGCSLQYTNDLSVMRKVSKLKLDHNDLEGEKIGQLPVALTTLTLAYNHLMGLPAVLNSLVNLTFLDLSFNRIESIYGIDSLINLTDLNLDDNLLMELPESMCVLVKIRKISVKRNKIGRQAVTRPGGQSIPAALFEDTALDHLDLTGNLAICKADVMSFAGIERFLARWQALKDKNFTGGGYVEGNLFGLE